MCVSTSCNQSFAGMPRPTSRGAGSPSPPRGSFAAALSLRWDPRRAWDSLAPWSAASLSGSPFSSSGRLKTDLLARSQRSPRSVAAASPCHSVTIRTGILRQSSSCASCPFIPQWLQRKDSRGCDVSLERVVAAGKVRLHGCSPRSDASWGKYVAYRSAFSAP